MKVENEKNSAQELEQVIQMKLIKLVTFIFKMQNELHKKKCQIFSLPFTSISH